MAATERGGKNRGRQQNDTSTLIVVRLSAQKIKAAKAGLGQEGLDRGHLAEA